MTSDAPRRAGLAGLVLLGIAAALAPASAADTSYPFEGTWIRANRVCAANAPRVRTYTAHEVTSPGGHCAYRKVAAGSGQFEIFEDCRRADHPGNFTETIRMLGPDLMQMRRQAARLKIARPLRYARCTVAAPPAAGTAKASSASGPHHMPPAAAPRGAEPPEPRDPDDHAPKPPAVKP